jgi:hypothetical protein
MQARTYRLPLKKILSEFGKKLTRGLTGKFHSSLNLNFERNKWLPDVDSLLGLRPAAWNAVV